MTPAVADLLAADLVAPVAQALAAYLGTLGTEPADAAAARRRFTAFAASLDRTALPPRERLQTAAAKAFLAGELREASALLEELTLIHSRDALVLFVGHQLARSRPSARCRPGHGGGCWRGLCAGGGNGF